MFDDRSDRKSYGGNRQDAYQDEFGRTSRPIKRDRSRSPIDDDRRQRQRRRSTSRDNTREGSSRYDDHHHHQHRQSQHRLSSGGDMYSGSHSDSRYTDPAKLDYIVSFRQFADYMRQHNRDENGRSGDAVDDDTMTKKYALYKEGYLQRSLSKLYKENKDEEWFKEKYHPEDSKPLRDTINQRKAELFTAFKEDMTQGVFSGVDFDERISKNTNPTLDAKPAATSSSSGADASTAVEEGGDNAVAVNGEEEGAMISGGGDDDDTTAKPDDSSMKTDAEDFRLYSPERSFSLFIKSVPLSLKRASLMEVCSATPGFKYVVLSDPNPVRRNQRLGWIVFDSEENVNSALSVLNGKKVDENSTLYVSLNAPLNVSSRSVPQEAGSLERLEKDVAQIKSLAQTLDSESGLSGVDLISAAIPDLVSTIVMDPEESQKEHEIKALKKTLDLYIVYLRRVHTFDYYSAYESNSPEDFSRRSGVHLRGVSGGSNPHNNMHPDRFFERLDSRIKLRINKPLDGEEIEKMGGKKLETEEDNVVATYVQKESEGKYRCTECTKLFKGEEFVKKHVRLKHPNLLESVKADVDLFNTFVRDPHKMSSNTTTTTSTTTVGGGGNRIDNYQQSSYHQRNSYGGGGASNGGGGYNDRRSGGFAPRGGYNDRRSGGYGGGAPRPPPPRGDARMDPRQIRSYVDLDAPADGEVDINYG